MNYCTGIHQFKLSIAKSVGNKKLVRHDPIPPVATSIAAEAHLLCFDEFQVTTFAALYDHCMLLYIVIDSLILYIVSLMLLYSMIL